jgi:hypothetical protein
MLAAMDGRDFRNFIAGEQGNGGGGKSDAVAGAAEKADKGKGGNSESAANVTSAPAVADKGPSEGQ